MKFFQEIQQKPKEGMSRDKSDFKKQELQHELGHERNNIAISINGRTWKVVPCKGTADSKEEWSHLNNMKSWAEKKSASTGKKWTVSLTGAPVSETVKPEVQQPVTENEDSPVLGAIIHRIMVGRTDLLAKYGPERIMTAAEDVADFAGDVEEIGSSDVSGWVKQVERMLEENPPKAFGEAGGKRPVSPDPQNYDSDWDYYNDRDEDEEEMKDDDVDYENMIDEASLAEGEEDPQSELKLINQKLKDAYKQVRNNSSVSIGWYMSQVKKLKARREELIKQLRQGVAEGSLNEFAQGNGGGDDGEAFNPGLAKMAQEHGFTKGASLADGASLATAFKITEWDQQFGGLYKQHFAQGFKKGRMDKINHNNKQYNLNLKLMKDGSIIRGEQGVAEGTSPGYTVNVRGNNFSYSRLKDALSDGHPSAAKIYKNGKLLGTIGSLGQQGVAEGFNGEYNDEAGMAKSNLRTMARAVNGLIDTIGDNDNLPEWAQEKLAKAEMITTEIWDYLLSQKEQGIDPKVDEASLAQMRDYFSQADNNTVAVDNKYGAPERKQRANVPPEIQTLINKMYRVGKITPQELDILKRFQAKTGMNVGIKEADMSTGNQGYDSMLAVMKAVDAGHDATFNLGGEPITLEYPEARFLAGKYKAFLKAGRQEEFLKYMENPMAFDRLMKQLRDLIAKQKSFKGSVPGERGVEEGTMNKVSVLADHLQSKSNDVAEDARTFAPLSKELMSRTGTLRKQAVASGHIAESLPKTNEGYYWCSLNKKSKLIPEGYKKIASGYITRK